MSDQAAFAAALLDPAASPPPGLAGPEGQALGRRFEVYRNNVVASLISALGEAYPVVKAVVGEIFFDAMAGIYVRAHPPKSPLMMQFGDAFPAFVSTFPPAANLPYLSDLARLEEARRMAYHAADDPVFDPALLSAVAPETLEQVRLIPQAATQVIASDYPILGIWAAHHDGPKPENRAENVLVSRPASDVTLHLISPGQAAFIRSLIARATLGVAAAAGQAADPDFDLSETIGLTLGTEILTRIETSDKGETRQ